MARIIPGVTVSLPATGRADPLTDLTLLLNRLQRTILRADAEREARLRSSEYERAKARANINYARSLLTKLEQEALAVKIHARRQDVQADLVRKREVLDQLSERLSDLAEIAAAARSDGADEADTSDGEDILADIIATPSESVESSRSPEMPPEKGDEQSGSEPADGPESSPPPPPAPTQAQSEVMHEKPATKPPEPTTASSPAPALHPTTTTSQTLRSRRPEPTASTTTGSPATTAAAPPATATATTTSSSALFPHRRNSTTSPTAATASSATTEAILDHHRAEQDALSASILQLASELKASSRAFGASLHGEDRELVERAGRGLRQTGERMEAVTRRAGVLRRMAEGEGWWGRLRLYVLVYGLMVVCVLVVGVGPKLRF